MPSPHPSNGGSSKHGGVDPILVRLLLRSWSELVSLVRIRSFPCQLNRTVDHHNFSDSLS